MSKEDPISSNKNSQVKQENGQTTFDWMQFVDSTQTISIQNEIADSLVLYFMKDDAPRTAITPQFIFWKNGLELGDEYIGFFNTWVMLNNTHFIFEHHRRSTLGIRELDLSNGIREYGTVLIDLTKETKNCDEISYSRSSLQEGQIHLTIMMYDNCFTKPWTKKLIYDPKL